MDFTGIIIGLIAGVFSTIAVMSQKKGMYITADRKEWRDFIHKWQVNTYKILIQDKTFVANYGYSDITLEGALQCQKIDLCSRLNPNRDKKLIESIEKIQLHDFKDFDKVVKHLNNVLKHDWEKVKNEMTFLGSGLYINLLCLVYIPYIIYKNFSILIHFSFEKAAMFYALVFGCFAIAKLFYSELLRIQFIRNINSQNLFNEKPRLGRGINLIELLVIAILVFCLPLIDQLYSESLILDIEIEASLSKILIIILITIAIITGISRYIYRNNDENNEKNK